MANSRKKLDVSDDQKKVLDLALEFYIRLGLGQMTDIAVRLDLLHGKRINPEKMERIRQLCEEMETILWEEGDPWDLGDDETSLYTLNAFLLESKMNGRLKATNWAEKRIQEIKDKTQEKIQ